AVIGATFTLVLFYLPLATVLIARGHAAGAADAAALAAADAASGFTAGTPCSVAEFVAAANRSTLVNCGVEGSTATVAVSVHVGAFNVSSRATAGQPIAVDR
ncbi:MAG: hypothetical protein H7248_02720, partial [Microbacteriaceae bacterium]|nr:hypothetical protein [Microbacteriaceae bacterium]